MSPVVLVLMAIGVALVGCGGSDEPALTGVQLKKIQDSLSGPSQQVIDIKCPSSIPAEGRICGVALKASRNTGRAPAKKECWSTEIPAGARYQIAGRVDGKPFLVQFDCHPSNFQKLRAPVENAFEDPLLSSNAPAQARAYCKGEVERLSFSRMDARAGKQASLNIECADGRRTSISYGPVP